MSPDAATPSTSSTRACRGSKPRKRQAAVRRGRARCARLCDEAHARHGIVVPVATSTSNVAAVQPVFVNVIACWPTVSASTRTGVRPTYVPSTQMSAPPGSVVTKTARRSGRCPATHERRAERRRGRASSARRVAALAHRSRRGHRDPVGVARPRGERRRHGDRRRIRDCRRTRVRPATVAIVGRPNVGKSALFNRLIGQRLAIVDDTPGVTRDRLYALAEWRGRTFSFVDTAGIDDDAGRRRRDRAPRRARKPRSPRAKPTSSSSSSTRRPGSRRSTTTSSRSCAARAVRCCSSRTKPSRSACALRIPGEFARLGFGEPIVVSAIHGEGTGDLLDAIVERLPPEREARRSRRPRLALAIVGQPNVGKSSLLNALLGEERTIVSDVPGTTRDAIDTLFTYHERRIRLDRHRRRAQAPDARTVRSSTIRRCARSARSRAATSRSS